MEFFGVMFGLSATALFVASVGAALLYPVFWVWMLVDSIVRDDRDFPGGGTTNEKLVWVLLNAFVQPVVVIYFFMVYRNAGRRVYAAGPGTGQRPTPPASPSAA